jgi:hypothetical protein
LPRRRCSCSSRSRRAVFTASVIDSPVIQG